MPAPSPSPIPVPRSTSPLRVLAGIACVAVTVAALTVTVLAVQLLGSVDSLDRNAQDAVSELREASRELRRSATAP